MSRDEEATPWGSPADLNRSQARKYEAHDGRCYCFVGVQLSHHLIYRHRFFVLRKGEKGEGGNAAKGIQIVSLLHDACCKEQAKPRQDQDQDQDRDKSNKEPCTVPRYLQSNVFVPVRV
jgi:hypothetical protein